MCFSQVIAWLWVQWEPSVLESLVGTGFDRKLDKVLLTSLFQCLNDPIGQEVGVGLVFVAFLGLGASEGHLGVFELLPWPLRTEKPEVRSVLMVMV